MSLSGIIQHLRRTWPVAALCILFGLVAGVAYGLTAAQTYSATTTVLVSPNAALLQTLPGNSTLSNAYEAALYSQQRAAAYAQLVTSPRVTGPVVEQLQLNETPDALAGSLEATSVPNTALLHITASGTSPRQAGQVANAVGRQLAVVVDQVERPSGLSTAPVKLATVAPAPLTSAATSSGLPRATLLGLLGGLLVAVAIVFVLYLLDTTVAGVSQIVEITGSAPLATVADGQRGSARIISADEPASAAAESYRRLRTSFQFLDVDDPPHSVVVASAQPNDLAPVVASNLAIALAAAGHNVVLVDANLRQSTLSRLMNVDDPKGLSAVLAGQAGASGLLHAWGTDALQVLPAGRAPANPADPLASPAMAEALAELEKRSDIVIVTAAPIIEYADATAVGGVADGVLLVLEQGRTRRSALRDALAAIGDIHTRFLGTVLYSHEMSWFGWWPNQLNRRKRAGGSV